MLNRKGKRFLDEGEDLGLYTYAKTGAAILEQPGAMAWQIFDQQTVEHLEGRYVTSDPIQADTLDELIDILDFDDRDAAKQSLRDYNAAAANLGGFDPSRKDGLKTSGLNPEKDKLGATAGQATLRRVFRNWRHHFHIRRRQSFRICRGDGGRLAAHPRPICLWGNGRRTIPWELSRRFWSRLRRSIWEDSW
jgi:hypothetical protein